MLQKCVRSSVSALLTSQVQCVLATVSTDSTPHTALMAYSFSDDLRSVYLATPLAARKAENMIARPTVSLLFDNRTGNLEDHGDGLLVTARGTAGQVSCEEDSAIVNAAFLAKNPNMEKFLESPGVGLFRLDVAMYEAVHGYDKPISWDPRKRKEEEGGGGGGEEAFLEEVVEKEEIDMSGGTDMFGGDYGGGDY
jgi:hypothetical protein